VRIHSFWLIGGALVLQVLAISVVPTWPRAVLVSAHLVSYLMAGWFVWLNRRVSGLPILAGLAYGRHHLCGSRLVRSSRRAVRSLSLLQGDGLEMST
jgi:hypothetical protein